MSNDPARAKGLDSFKTRWVESGWAGRGYITAFSTTWLTYS